MKRILRVGKGYALTKHQLKYLNIRYLSLLAVVMSMCLYAVKQVSAQQAEPAATAVADIKPLQIGDTIPEWLWHHPLHVVNHPDGKDTITLNDYRGKLIILDFWATWCSPCITAMPAIHAVQENFANDMTVILISSSDTDETTRVLQSHKTLAPLQLSSVVGAEVIQSLFPHRVVPHYAWINTEHKVVATTAANDITVENIAKVLRGETPDYALKSFIDIKKPLLFQSADLPKSAEMQQYAVLIKGKIPGLSSKVTVRESGGQIYGMAISNKSLSSMYTILVRQMVGENPTKLLTYADTIVDNDRYTFDFISPMRQMDSLYIDMLDYLNRYSEYRGRWVKQSRPCLVLKAKEKRGFVTKGGMREYESTANSLKVMNYPIKDFVSRLNWEDISGHRIALNETGFVGNVDVVLRPPFDDLAGIRKQLNTQGLDIIEAEREVLLFEISRDPQP